MVAVVFAYIVMSDGVIGMQYLDHDGKHYPVGIRFLSQVIVNLTGSTIFFTYKSVKVFEYNQTFPQWPPWAQSTVAIVERWLLWAGRGVNITPVVFFGSATSFF